MLNITGSQLGERKQRFIIFCLIPVETSDSSYLCEGLFSMLLVCLPVCLSAGLHKKYRTNFPEARWRGETRANKGLS